VLNLPPIICLSTSGDFEYQLEALEGQPPTQLGSVMQGLIGAANEDHNLARVFSTFTATNPSIFLDIDRDKAQALGVGISNIFRPYGRHHRKPKIAKIPYVMILRNLSKCWREGRENSKEIETEIAENWNAPLAQGATSASPSVGADA
jgi:hypothetical protein